ncbi:hypothetical protein CCR75_004697 [Bremia lactucae]|uniref:Uncharacterized protein n=1 Tax=Bremia lactucae TaxID=4779 RepID=A0A976IJE0_BRELC|nr:hypothetical protein CCR75_004697 [Bremia lactucae]
MHLSLSADCIRDVDSMNQSPDRSDECLNDTNDKTTAMIKYILLKPYVAQDDDMENDFYQRTAAIQGFTDRVEVEHRLMRTRMLNAHADVSESLLDALTDLMVQEGGIEMEKLVCDINVDGNGGGTFTQEDQI